MTQKFHELSYDELDAKVEELHKLITEDSFVPDTILAIARGGWFPARVLSDIYSSQDIPVDVVSVTTKFYTNIGKTGSRPVLVQELHSLFDQRVLIVDDVSDSGSTLKFIKGYAQWLGARYIKVATVFMKPRTKVIPDYFVDEIPNDTWIVFPYEKRETKFLLNEKGEVGD